MTLSHECCSELKPIVERAMMRDADEACIVSAMFDIIATCEKHGYMYDAVLTPKQVGVHPKSRDG